jgi:hypothetical protein
MVGLDMLRVVFEMRKAGCTAEQIGLVTSGLAEPPPEKQGGKRGTRLPADFRPSPEMREYARRQGMSDAQIDTEATKIRDWSASSPNGAKLNWPAAWRNWVTRNGHKRNGHGTLAERNADFYHRMLHEDDHGQRTDQGQIHSGPTIDLGAGEFFADDGRSHERH